MALDAKTGKYMGRIPASFADPKRALMYSIFPDLEVETPYVVLPAKP